MNTFFTVELNGNQTGSVLKLIATCLLLLSWLQLIAGSEINLCSSSVSSPSSLLRLSAVVSFTFCLASFFYCSPTPPPTTTTTAAASSRWCCSYRAHSSHYYLCLFIRPIRALRRPVMTLNEWRVKCCRFPSRRSAAAPGFTAERSASSLSLTRDQITSPICTCAEFLPWKTMTKHIAATCIKRSSLSKAVLRGPLKRQTGDFKR